MDQNRNSQKRSSEWNTVIHSINIRFLVSAPAGHQMEWSRDTKEKGKKRGNDVGDPESRIITIRVKRRN